MPRFRFFVVDRFLAEAQALRRRLDARLDQNRDPFDASRFRWERWHIDGQFSQLRTPARDFFGADLASVFERAVLRAVGREIGPVELASPPWLSIVVDRDFQGIHRDSPNGHFAFSFGLGREARYRGGETLLANDDLLDYFGRGAHRDGAAADPLFDEIPSRFNRLVVFDARLPHGVREVQGPRAPKDGRIAIQGWVRLRGATASGIPESDLRARARAAMKGVRVPGVEGLVALALEGTKRVVRIHTLVATTRTANVQSAVESIRRASARVRVPASTKASLAIRVEGGKGRID
jgi:hypothetical protein